MCRSKLDEDEQKKSIWDQKTREVLRSFTLARARESEQASWGELEKKKADYGKKAWKCTRDLEGKEKEKNFTCSLLRAHERVNELT